MKSGKYLKGKLKALFDKVEMNKENEAIFSELIDNLDERDSHLSSLANEWDNEAEDIEFTPKTIQPADDWQDKYDDMKQRYIERFFNGDTKTFEQSESASNEPNVAGDSTPAIENFLVEE